MPLRLLEPLHDAQLDVGFVPRRHIEADGPDQQRNARQHHQGVPDVPEPVVARPHEHEHHGLDRDQHQPRDDARLDAALRAAPLPVHCGGEGDDEEWDGLKQGVEFGEAGSEDHRGQHQRQPSGDGDGRHADPHRQRQRAEQRLAGTRQRARPMQQDPGQEDRRSDVGRVEEEAVGLVAGKRQPEWKDSGEGQHVLEPQEADDDAREHQRERPPMPAEHDIGGREGQDHRQRDHHGAVQHRDVPGQGQRGVWQERTQHRNQHQRGRRQQGQ